MDTSAQQNLPGSQPNSSFYVAVICPETAQHLTATLDSINRQKSETITAGVGVFYAAGNNAGAAFANNPESYPYHNTGHLLQLLSSAVIQSNATYCVIANCGDRFLDGAFASAATIFNSFQQINWLTGIQVVQAPAGFNITTGNSAMRRWVQQNYSLNNPAVSGRDIAPASTFFRTKVWASLQNVTAASSQNLFDALWQALFKSQQLYTCKTYFSAALNTGITGAVPLQNPGSYTLIEKGYVARLLEFCFIQNIPLLRSLYQRKNGFAPLVRFNHASQTYFLSGY